MYPHQEKYLELPRYNIPLIVLKDKQKVEGMIFI